MTSPVYCDGEEENGMMRERRGNWRGRSELLHACVRTRVEVL